MDILQGRDRSLGQTNTCQPSQVIAPYTCCVMSGVILGRFHIYLFIYFLATLHSFWQAWSRSSWRSYQRRFMVFISDAHDSVFAAEQQHLCWGEFPNRSEWRISCIIKFSAAIRRLPIDLRDSWTHLAVQAMKDSGAEGAAPGDLRTMNVCTHWSVWHASKLLSTTGKEVKLILHGVACAA